MPPPSQPRDDAAMVATVVSWFAVEGRELPWRADVVTPWGILVSEVMLQQTPVARVEPVWREWITRWPTPASLASATQADAVRAWGRLGYPRRAARLWECAHTIVAQWDGQVPRDPQALRMLPGVGEYTAAAVLAFAFGERAIVLDTNVRRVIARAWNAEPLPRPHLVAAERAVADALAPTDPTMAARWAVASMELGAVVCTARAPQCTACPIAHACRWLADGRPGLAQAPRRSQAWNGTDRQVRGRMLALLRESHDPVRLRGHRALADVEPEQFDRCLASLLADGLASVAAEETFTL